MVVDGCNNIWTQSRRTNMPQLSIGMYECRFVNNVIFIVKVNPVDLKCKKKGRQKKGGKQDTQHTRLATECKQEVAMTDSVNLLKDLH